MGGEEIRTSAAEGVSIVRMERPPHNFFDARVLSALADAIEAAERDSDVRVTLLISGLKNFCAGANFRGDGRIDPVPIYAEAARLMARRKPLIAAIGGAAIGGGLGLALTADFRIGDRTATLQANFTRLAISPGFGLTYTLPRTIGLQKSRDMFMTSRRIGAEEALRLGLLDRVTQDDLFVDALSFAREIADNSPIAVEAVRRLMGPHSARDFREAVERELAEQTPLFASADFEEGIRAAAERRTPVFKPLEGQTQEL